MAKIRKCVFEELERVKNLIKVRFPEVDIRNWCPLLSRLGTYHYNKRKGMLLGKEREFWGTVM